MNLLFERVRLGRTSRELSENKMNIKSIIKFCHLLENLKTTKRTGWLQLGIKNPESIADHIFRVAVLTLFLAPKNFNRDHAVKIALIHDLAEAITGDPIKYPGGKKVKNFTQIAKKEREALINLLGLTDQQEFISLYDEYVATKTPEARIVKQIDKLERAIQAQEYAEKYNIDPKEFYTSAESIITDPNLKKILESLK